MNTEELTEKESPAASPVTPQPIGCLRRIGATGWGFLLGVLATWGVWQLGAMLKTMNDFYNDSQLYSKLLYPRLRHAVGADKEADYNEFGWSVVGADFRNSLYEYDPRHDSESTVFETTYSAIIIQGTEPSKSPAMMIWYDKVNNRHARLEVVPWLQNPGPKRYAGPIRAKQWESREHPERRDETASTTTTKPSAAVSTGAK